MSKLLDSGVKAAIDAIRKSLTTIELADDMEPDKVFELLEDAKATVEGAKAFIVE